MSLPVFNRKSPVMEDGSADYMKSLGSWSEVTLIKVKTITSLPERSVGIEINQSEFAAVHYFHTCPGYRVGKMIGGAVQVRNEMSKIMTQLRIDENIAKVIGQMLEIEDQRNPGCGCASSYAC